MSTFEEKLEQQQRVFGEKARAKLHQLFARWGADITESDLRNPPAEVHVRVLDRPGRYEVWLRISNDKKNSMYELERIDGAT